MARIFAVIILGILLSAEGVHAATGKVTKVLPQFLDLQGRNALSPSLYDRDAYQVILRDHPEKRSAMVYNVDFKAKGPLAGELKLILELRGITPGKDPLPQRMVVHQKVKPTHWYGRWTEIKITGEDFVNLGEINSWRVSLWDGDNLLSEQKSFLWVD